MEILQQQEVIINELSEARKSLNQTMRDALANPKDKNLSFQTEYANGVFLISRRIHGKDLIGDSIPKFEKSPTTVSVLRDLTEEDVRKPVSMALLELLGLIDRGGLPLIIGDEIQNKNIITVQYPLKGNFNKELYTNARFTIKKSSKQTIGQDAKTPLYTLLRGEDPENNSFFFRITPFQDENAIITQMVRECVVVFNKSHRLEMSSVKLPGQMKENSHMALGAHDDSYSVIKKLSKFDSAKHDPTLYFLRSKYPASRFITPSGDDDGFPNERDVVAMTSHMRGATWEMAQLHWAYEGLCSVVASMVMVDSSKIPKTKMGAPRPYRPKLQLAPLGTTPGVVKADQPLATTQEDDTQDEAQEDPPPVDIPRFDPKTLEGYDPTTQLNRDEFGRYNTSNLRSSADRNADPIKRWTNDSEFITWLLNPKTTPKKWETCINNIHNYVSTGLHSDEKAEMKFSSTSHDATLKQIARMAKLATDVFTIRMKYETTTGLKQLTSLHNSIIAVADLDSPAYFGYKMTQWLLSSVEMQTLLIAKKDQNTSQKNLRARLRHVNCQFYTAGLKSTYTTDVLLGITRKRFISPWQVMFGCDEADWPAWLKAYSIQTHFTNVPWAVGIDDKQVSVVLDITYKIRFTFNAFRRKFEGSDPTVASKKMAEAVVKLKSTKGMIAKKGRHTTRKVLQPVTGEKKGRLLDKPFTI
jgi:hypothetical protein